MAEVTANVLSDILHGKLENLPKPKTHVVRVFLSSTFTDTATERNHLITRIIPRLKTYCRQKHGVDFQVVDMRWGVRDQASLDHSTSALCMKEIALCQDQSIGPTFVVFLGQRYGFRPLPSTIREDEMQLITSSMTPEEREMIDKWYVPDYNAIPPQYVLQPIDRDLDKYDEPEPEPEDTGEEDPFDYVQAYLNKDKNEEEKKQKRITAARKRWAADEKKLAASIRKAVDGCVQSGSMSDTAARKYFWSVTEEEVHHGLELDSNPGAHCLFFDRHLTDINLQHPKAWRFIELNDDSSLNTDTLQRLDHLKKSITQKLPPENIFRFSVPWSDDEGVNADFHKEYLEEIGNTFESAMIRLIDHDINTRKLPLLRGIPADVLDEVVAEVLEQCHSAKTKTSFFKGRENLLQTIKDYATFSSESVSQKPLIVCGESGSGRTALLAKAAQQVLEQSDEDTLVVFRLLGISPTSSSAQALLDSLYKQILILTHLHNIPPPFYHPKSKDLREMAIEFQKLITWFGTLDLKLVIFVDSLDRLTATQNTFSLKWLPKELPGNIRFVLSIMPKFYRLVDTLKVVYGLGDGDMLQVPSMDRSNSINVLKQLLRHHGRTLTEDQDKTVSDCIRKLHVQPLYLKLLHDDISQWRSYQSDLIPQASIEDYIKVLFEKLEQKHGKTIVEHALGYLSLSCNGLSEQEMEDILSLDDVVLSDVFQYHVPPVRRLPSILWARIRSDLSEYIVEHDANGSQVMTWYYRQFREAALERYFMRSTGYYNHQFKPKVLVFIDYFTGAWASGRPKPFTYTPAQQKKLKLKQANSEAVRYVSEQPDILRMKDLCEFEDTVFNQRKIAELQHLLKLHNSYQIGCKLLNQQIATNFGFLLGFLKHHSWSEVMANLKSISHKHDVNWYYQDTKEVALLQQTLAMCYTSFLGNLQMLGPSILSHLLLFYGHLKGISKLIDEIDGVGLRLCALVPPHQQQKTPGGEMESAIHNHIGPVGDITSTVHAGQKTSRLYPTGYISVSRKVVVTDEATGEIIVDLTPNIPDGDHFQKVALVSEHFDRSNITARNLCAASLANRPWVYLLNIHPDEQSVLDVKKLEKHIPGLEGHTITVLRVIHFKEILVAAANHLFLFGNLSENDGKILKIVECESNIRECLVYSSVPKDAEPRIEHVLVVCDTGAALYDNQWNVVDDYKFSNSDLAHVNLKHCKSKKSVMVLVNSDTMTKLYCRGSQIVAKQYIHSVASVFHLSCRVKQVWADGEEQLETMLCTENCLVCIVDCRNEESNHQVVFEVKGQTYAGASIRGPTRHKDYVLYSSRGGVVDIFKVKDEGSVYHVMLLLSLKAHGTAITRMHFPVQYEYTDSFSTGSSDGSVKVWQLQKARAAHQHMPHFDHTAVPITNIQTTNFKAFTRLQNDHKIMVQWDLVSGHISQYYSNDKISCGFTHITANQGILVGIDGIDHKHCVTWPLVKESQGDSIPATWCATSPLDIIFNTDDPLILDGDGSTEIWIVTRGTKVTQWYCCDTENNAVNTLNKDTGIQNVQSGIRIRKGVLMLYTLTDLYILNREDSNIEQFSLSDILNPGERIIHVAAGQRPSVLLLSDKKLYVWNTSSKKMQNTIQFAQHLHEALDMGSVVISVDQGGTMVMIGLPSQIILLNARTGHFQGSVNVPDGQEMRYATLTPDGGYFTYATNKRFLFLYRCRDVTVLAKYIMYTDITALAVSQNSWFVVCGTADCRLISLVIADYTVPEHKQRIEHVRRANACVPKTQVHALIELYNPRFYQEVNSIEEDWSKASSGIIIDCDGTTSKTLASYDIRHGENQKAHKANFVLKPMTDFKRELLLTPLQSPQAEESEMHEQQGRNKASVRKKFKDAQIALSKRYFIQHGQSVFS